MVLVIIRHEDIMHSTAVPNELADFILPSQWNTLANAISSSYDYANFWSCVVEIGCCVVFVFPFIFCCHPCISGTIAKSKMEENVRNLNYSLFQGQSVLSLMNGDVYVNTDYIVIGNTTNQYVSRTNTLDSSTYNAMNRNEYNKDDGSVSSVGSNTSGVNAVLAQATAVSGPGAYGDQSSYIEVVASPVETVRSIAVIIPPGAGPGSILTVMAPNGTTLSVVAPAGSYPGKEIMRDHNRRPVGRWRWYLAYHSLLASNKSFGFLIFKMVLVVVKHVDVSSVSMIPAELRDFITDSQWSIIQNTLDNSKAYANMLTCGIEICVCIVFAFPCIFCCHPCIAIPITRGDLQSKTRMLNAQLFAGDQVLSIMDGDLYINTDHMRNRIVIQQQPVFIAPQFNHQQQQMLVVEAVPVQMNMGADPSYAKVHSQEPVQVSPTVVRSFKVAVPAGVQPGGAFNATAADGTVVQVQAPADSFPGKELTVQY